MYTNERYAAHESRVGWGPHRRVIPTLLGAWLDNRVRICLNYPQWVWKCPTLTPERKLKCAYEQRICFGGYAGYRVLGI